MKIELIGPSTGKRLSRDDAVELAARVLDNNGRSARGVKLIWSVVGSQGKLEQQTTTTDREGNSANRLTLSGEPGAQGSTVLVETADGQMRPLGVLHLHDSSEGLVGRFVPLQVSATLVPPQKVAQPAKGAPRRPGVAPASPNQLKIYYPTSDFVLSFASTPLWVQYVDANGTPIPNELIDGTITNGAFGVVGWAQGQRFIGKTDEKGWVRDFMGSIFLSVNSVSPNMPDYIGKPTTVDMLFTVFSVKTPTDRASADVTASNTMGGPGNITFQNFTPQAGRWNLANISYQLSDGTPAKYKPLTCIPNSDFNPLNFKGYSFFTPEVISDDSGNAHNFLWVDHAPSAQQIRPSARSPNLFNANGIDNTGAAKTVAAASGPAPTATIQVQWLDPLTLNGAVRVQATFKKANGDPIKSATITWNAVPGGPAGFDSATSQTNASGVATNTLRITGANLSYAVGVWAEGIDPDTQAYVNGVQVGYFYDRSQAAPSLDWEVEILPSGTQPLNFNQPYTFRAKVRDAYGDPVTNQPVTWAAAPSDRIVVDPPYPTVTNDLGETLVTVTGTGTDDMLAAITAQVANPQTGTYFSDTEPVNFGAAGNTGIVIQPPPDGLPLSLYDSHTLTATVPPNSGVTHVVWSAGDEQPQPEGRDLGHTFMFYPNPSPVLGPIETTITAVGRNRKIDKVTIYARADYSPFRDQTSTRPGPAKAAGSTLTGHRDLAFKEVDNPPKSTLGLISLDDNPVVADVFHLILAKHLDADGNPVGGTLQWSPQVHLLTNQTTTLSDGTSTNGWQILASAGSTDDVLVKADDGARVDLMLGVSQDGIPPKITIDPPLQPLTIDQEIQLPATYPGSADGTQILWAAYPGDQIEFEQRTTRIQDQQTSNVITAKGDAAFTGYISASTFNAQTGERDHGNLTLNFTPAVHGIQVGGPDSTPLYTGAQLTATNLNPAADNVTCVKWSAEAQGYTFDFEPKSSNMTDGKATTTLTVTGPDTTVTADVYARSTKDVFPPVIPKSITFTSVPVEQLPPGGVIDVESLENPPLLVGKQHPITATYTRKKDGSPYPDRSVQWSGAGLTFVPNPSKTGPDGVATTFVTATAAGSPTITASATNPDNGAPESGNLPLAFAPTQAPVPGAGKMTITPQSGDLTLGQPVPFNVNYVDADGTPMAPGTNVTWYAVPGEGVIFGENPSPITDNQGNATTTVTGRAESDDVCIYTSALNAETGANDLGQAGPFTFKQAPGLYGIQLDKAYAQNDPDIKYPQSLIKAQVQVVGYSSQQQVLLSATDSRVSMFDTRGNPLPKDPGSGDYYIMTSPVGGVQSGTFLLGASNYTRFTLKTRWQDAPQPAVSADLVIATNDRSSNGVLPAPTGVGPNLSIPDGAATFKVSIPSPVSPIAVLLNDRLIFQGTNPSGGVDVAYAALNLGSDGNDLVYLGNPGSITRQSKPLHFKVTSGTPQKEPTPGPLPPPVVVANAGTVGPGDITGEGLAITVPAYPGMTPGDLVTVYCYLTGTDVLSVELGTPMQLWNVVPLSYTVGQSTPVYLPQWAAAGYSNGNLQVNYQARSQWSQVTKLTLNTTL